MNFAKKAEYYNVLVVLETTHDGHGGDDDDIDDISSNWMGLMICKKLYTYIVDHYNFCLGCQLFRRR